MNRVCEVTVGITRPTAIQSKIKSLCNRGRLKEALNILDSKPILQDLSLYSPILQLCINLRAEKEGRFVHDHVLRNGLNLDLHFNTKLVIFYSKIGDIKAAYIVFDRMSSRSVVSWTAMISGFAQKGYSKDALEVFKEMHRSGVKANQFTYGSVLKACTNMLSLEVGKQIQGCIVKGIFLEDLFVQSALVCLHSKCGRLEDAQYLFERMLERDTVSWNALIGGYAVQGLADVSFGMFQSMLRDGMMPDQFTFGSVLRACGGGKALNKVKQIHGLIIQLGFGSYEVVTGSLIDAYAKSGRLRSAKLLYDSMPEKDLISCTALITRYAHVGGYRKEAFGLFGEIIQMQMGMDSIILCSMLNICANVALLSLGRQIHAISLKKQPNCDVAMGNAFIDMYAKSGEIDDANRAFDDIKEKNVISWTSLIAGYGKHGYGDKAIKIFEKMEDNNLKPNDVTFLTLLFACSHTGMTTKGWECFTSMVNTYKISPRVEHYACMVDLLARGGQLEEAYELVSKMSIKPNTSIWGSILGACRIYGNTSLGEVAARNLFDLDPRNAVNYVALAGIYAAAGLWENASEMRKLMKDRRIEKDPAWSSVQCMKEKFQLLAPGL
ncbi:pentatricopeptide repeat-containing protein At3g20730 [Macadamia integrifolia]|uniref:pentatricopeptide repeat-containing protein At3g20730 n=1 Tax=Macadamia integrifolia TaxID=60698 RepID=UPI001C52A0C3|nr:pentatricopeptide repeat-containing protein At3g20730 [Macadamia integrifolia]XP_042520772.1 pentatricopeptide repeat-containing protein At3g20730 [Macadamia integrifolia]